MLTGIRDLDFKILNDLDDKSLVNYCSTNKEADKICENQMFWMNRVIIKFPYINLNTLKQNKGNKTWSEYYIEDLRKIDHINSNDYLTDGSKNGRLDHVMIAIQQGAEIHTFGDSAVKWSSYGGHLDVTKYLVSLGADIHSGNDLAIRWASMNGHLNVVKYLVSLGADIHAINDTAIRLASVNGHLDVVKYLVSLGACLLYTSPSPRD